MQSIPQNFPAPIVLKKDKKERKIGNPNKIFKGDHNLVAAVISRTYVKTNAPDGPLNYRLRRPQKWFGSAKLLPLNYVSPA